MVRHTLFLLLAFLAALTLSCSHTETLPYYATATHSVAPIGQVTGVPVTGGPSRAQRAAAIAAEPRGDYWIGRRYHVDRLRFWGYLRRPGQSWDQARLVIMDERLTPVPDRLPERGSGQINGYDNNVQYIIHGSFTGGNAYDPLSNLALPVFRPSSYQVSDPNPGWLFNPGERYDLYQITLQPPGGIPNELAR